MTNKILVAAVGAGLTPMVSALTSTSPGRGLGVGTSVYSRTDGSPVRLSKIAFMVNLQPAKPATAAIMAAIMARRSFSGKSMFGLPFSVHF